MAHWHWGSLWLGPWTLWLGSLFLLPCLALLILPHCEGLKLTVSSSGKSFFLCSYMLKFMLPMVSHHLCNFRVFARQLPSRHELHSIWSSSPKHGLISFDQKLVLISAYTQHHCFEIQDFRWLVTFDKLSEGGMGQAMFGVISIFLRLTLVPYISGVFTFLFP